jgi:hypothetical protein
MFLWMFLLKHGHGHLGRNLAVQWAAIQGDEEPAAMNAQLLSCIMKDFAVRSV